jgi:hypothetical protein
MADMSFTQERLLNTCGKCCSWFFTLCLLLGVNSTARAQRSATGEMRGTVADSSGAVVPGAVISVVNVNTGATKTFTTNKDGIYDTVSTPNGI